jgi:uncharacterized membrane protein
MNATTTPKPPSLLLILTFLAALGTGSVGGVFFAFSSFVMKALSRLPPVQGIAAMQSINVSVINLSFAIQLFGTAALCAFLGIRAVPRRQEAGAGYQIAGSLLYLGVTMAATFGFNVPLNDALAKIDPASSEGANFWTSFLSSWIAWNHVRTVGALAASMSFTTAIYRMGTGRIETK